MGEAYTPDWLPDAPLRLDDRHGRLLEVEEIAGTLSVFISDLNEDVQDAEFSLTASQEDELITFLLNRRCGKVPEDLDLSRGTEPDRSVVAVEWAKVVRSEK